MKSKFISLIFLLLCPICACEKKVEYEISDYILELNVEKEFKILQLTDIHLASKDDRARQYKFLDLTIKEANADMIVISGDLFTFASKKVAKELFSFLDSYKLPWTVIFGNHDEQCYFSIEWLTNYLNNLTISDDSYCLFKDLNDDNIYGNSNFAINLINNGKIKKQLIFMDSNRYYFNEYNGYDYIHTDQIKWYEDLIDYTTSSNSNEIVKSLLFYHIPIPEYNDAYDAYLNNEATLILGKKSEKTTCPNYNSNFYFAIKEKKSTEAMFVGHDHLNNFIIKYQDIYFAYGLHSTDRIYFDYDSLGGLLISIKEDNSLEFKQIKRKYEEYE